jgi:hypothetical protein
MMARRSNAVRPLTIISHQHQTGGIDIQTSCGVQFPGYRFIQKIEHRWVIRVVRGANIALRLIEHEVTWTVLLRQRVAIVSDIMFRKQFERCITDDFAIDGDTIAADFTPGNSTANAELLCDKFIKSHVCDFACKNGGRALTRKSELLSAQYSGLITSLKGKRSMAYY